MATEAASVVFATEYQAAIIADELPGIDIRHIYLEPPLKDKKRAVQIGERIGATLMELEDDKGRTRFTLPAEVTFANSVILDDLNTCLKEYGSSVKPLEGLSPEPTRAEYLAHIARRTWAAL